MGKPEMIKQSVHLPKPDPPYSTSHMYLGMTYQRKHSIKVTQRQTSYRPEGTVDSLEREGRFTAVEIHHVQMSWSKSAPLTDLTAAEAQEKGALAQLPILLQALFGIVLISLAQSDDEISVQETGEENLLQTLQNLLDH